MASGARIGLHTGRRYRMNPCRKEWRESKVRPVLGNSPHDRPVSRGYSSSRRICDDAFSATVLSGLHRTILGTQYAFSQAWQNLSGPMWYAKQNQTLGRNRATSRRSAPSPGSRTCREGHAPSHRPQMSSGRLFLDRVGRHQSPSPLRRHPQNKALAFWRANKYHRTAGSVLTVCVSRGDKRIFRST
jgi:hypothetical protein